MVRESVLDETWKEILRRQVRLDEAGDHVHARPLGRHDQVDARGPRHLGQAHDRVLDLARHGHHQVREFVDDHHDVGQPLGLGHRLVVGIDVLVPLFGQLAVSALHLGHDRPERFRRLLGLGDDGREQMRDAVVDRELEHLGVDHRKLDLVRPRIVQDRQDDGVDGHALAGAGGAGNEQVRHLVDAR